MTCQQCGCELPRDSHPAKKYCADCYDKRRRNMRYERAKLPHPMKTCLRCGNPLPPGCSPSRMFCDECGRLRNIELTMARQQRDKKQKATEEAARQASIDRAYCKICKYYSTQTEAYNLCDYMLKTGCRRGCKAGYGCKKREITKKETKRRNENENCVR